MKGRKIGIACQLVIKSRRWGQWPGDGGIDQGVGQWPGNIRAMTMRCGNSLQVLRLFDCMGPLWSQQMEFYMGGTLVYLIILVWRSLSSWKLSCSEEYKLIFSDKQHERTINSIELIPLKKNLDFDTFFTRGLGQWPGPYFIVFHYGLFCLRGCNHSWYSALSQKFDHLLK